MSPTKCSSRFRILLFPVTAGNYHLQPQTEPEAEHINRQEPYSGNGGCAQFHITHMPQEQGPEFKGLKSQYLFIFAGGLLALFVVFVIMYMVGIDQWVCIGFGVVSASVLVWATFRMNAKYGEWGLMKLHALRSHPRYIINRRKFLRLISPTAKKGKV